MAIAHTSAEFECVTATRVKCCAYSHFHVWFERSCRGIERNMNETERHYAVYFKSEEKKTGFMWRSQQRLSSHLKHSLRKSFVSLLLQAFRLKWLLYWIFAQFVNGLVACSYTRCIKWNWTKGSHWNNRPNNTIIVIMMIFVARRSFRSHCWWRVVVVVIIDAAFRIARTSVWMNGRTTNETRLLLMCT